MDLSEIGDTCKVNQLLSFGWLPYKALHLGREDNIDLVFLYEFNQALEIRAPAGVPAQAGIDSDADNGCQMGVEQLTRYLELLNRDPLLAPVQGIFAAQEIRPQARVLAMDRGIRYVTLD